MDTCANQVPGLISNKASAPKPSGNAPQSPVALATARRGTLERSSGRKAKRAANRLAVLALLSPMLAAVALAVSNPQVAEASSVSSVTVTVSPATAGSIATYTVDLADTSGLAASGTLTIDASSGAAGTVFPAAVSDYVITDETHSSGSVWSRPRRRDRTRTRRSYSRSRTPLPQAIRSLLPFPA